MTAAHADTRARAHGATVTSDLPTDTEHLALIVKFTAVAREVIAQLEAQPDAALARRVLYHTATFVNAVYDVVGDDAIGDERP